MEYTPQISTELYQCEALHAENLHEVRCEDCRRCGLDNKIWRRDLEDFTARVLERHGVNRQEADIVARVLVSSDLRGIPSHGVARLGRYLAGIRDGYIVTGARYEIVEPAPAIAVIDARDGLGQVVSEAAMDLAIAKAENNGIGLVTVKNSNHYGIAGYYALKALQKRMIGISMTNAAPLVVPTHGVQAILGTNPIAFGAPAGHHHDFLMDMATSVVPRGKLEVYDRNLKQMPAGWAVDERGFDCLNPGQVLKNLVQRLGGGILPLGGRGEEFSGYKGYGLAMMVDILCGVLSGSAYAAAVDDVRRQAVQGQRNTPRVGHFFLALDIGRFMPLAQFEARMDDLIEQIQESPTALDQHHIYIHGEKEFIRTELHEKTGIPVADNVLDTLRRIAAECDTAPPVTVAEHLAEPSMRR